MDDFEVLGESAAKKGNQNATDRSKPAPDTRHDQSRDSIDSNTSRTSSDSSVSVAETKNRPVTKSVTSDVKVKRYFKAPEGTWHMLDLDSGRRAVDTLPKKEIPEKEPEPKNSALTMPRTTSNKFNTINGNHMHTDKAINRTPTQNSVHVTSHDALYFIHEQDARVTWIYSLSSPPTSQSASSVSKGALKIVVAVLSHDTAEISDDTRESFTLQFRHPPSCHVLNRSTARHELVDNKPKIELELLIGFKSGDILLHDPIRKSFTKHFNKGVREARTC